MRPPIQALIAIFLALILASCASGTAGTNATPIPAQTTVPTPTSSPTAIASPTVPPPPPSPAAAPQPLGRPSLALNPPEGVGGQQVQVTGKGFVPGGKLRLRTGLPQAQAPGTDLAEAQADGSGQFAASFAAPTAGSVGGEQGSLLISAIDEATGEISAIAVFFDRQATVDKADEDAAQGVVITGAVNDVNPGAHVISIDEVHGFDTVALSRDVEITSADGSPKTLGDIKPGTVIQTAGSAIGSGAVLAKKIRILPVQGIGG